MSERYCAKHKPLHERPHYVSHEDKSRSNRDYNLNRRDEQANDFYHSSQWTKVRNYVVSRDMYTDAITGQVIDDKQLIVDHIIPRRLCDNPLDTENLWCLSKRMHNIKTKIEQSMDENKLKHVGKIWWQKILNEKR
ncbi:HNH endonuclease [Paucilactobacillus sp. N302-9]